MVKIMPKKKKRPPMPRIPEQLTIEETDGTNIFFMLDIKYDLPELSLVVYVMDEDELDEEDYEDEDDVFELTHHTLYSCLLESEQIEEMIKWLKKALKVAQYVEEYGPPMPTVAGFKEDE